MAARGRRLSGGQADLAAGKGEARDGIEQQEHALALVAKMLGNGHGGERGFAPQRCRGVGGRADHDAAREPVRAKVVLDEFAEFAPALADEAKHRDIETWRAREHGEQRGLADARRREEADALPLPHGGEQVEGADAKVLRDTPALDLTIDGRTEQRGAARAGDVVITRAIVAIGATGRTIAGGAGVGAGRHRRTKAATIDLGNVPQKRALATRIVVMPNGSLVEEVRP